MASFVHALRRANQERGLLICGLDPVFDKIPRHLLRRWDVDYTQLIIWFMIPIIDAVAPYVAGFKPNYAFFAAFDDVKNGRLWGQEALRVICRYIRIHYPTHLLILDAKDGDIGASNTGYFVRAFDGYDAHAVTWSSYLGPAIMKQMAEYPGRGILALARTSNPEGSRLQNTICEDGRPLYMHVVDEWLALWKYGLQVGLVAGATYPEELSKIRRRIGAMPLLIPGVGKQGGDAVEAARRGCGGRYGNVMINQSSTFLYASDGKDFAEAAGNKAAAEQARIYDAMPSLRA